MDKKLSSVQKLINSSFSVQKSINSFFIIPNWSLMDPIPPFHLIMNHTKALIMKVGQPPFVFFLAFL